jgi:hypothetical protein
MDAARDFRKSHPELTIEQSYERVYGSQRGLAKAYNDSLPRGGFIPQGEVVMTKAAADLRTIAKALRSAIAMNACLCPCT